MEIESSSATKSQILRKNHESYLQFDAKLARFGFLLMEEGIKAWRWDERRWNGRREDGGQVDEVVGQDEGFRRK